ncbi:Prefoldin subunit-domain-containing protein [Clohesyomyces aquaticus]|uniref:Prefoldin subunit-domain-containing protein n=1 Tax=Clohesyomyces aquaticus TaxID=1231657 RepID=A0A1Y2A4J5_9PLEO|nr:Prefoldin subunit-domain-containing protein [Clohesyomyces aquaticus]
MADSGTAGSGTDVMANLERHRLQLEENAAKLRQALKHWRTWELEYEMLKEELQNAKSPSPSDMVEIGRTLGGHLVNAKEVEELLGNDKQPRRSATQVVEMISRRVDYVQQNVATVEKQLQTAEKKLEAASVLLEPDIENEEGLPLMDIQEELDEEGNVISSNVLQPGKAAPEIVETLRKAGLKDVGQSSTTVSESAAEKTASKTTAATTNGTAEAASTENQNTPSSGATASAPTPKKSVSFSKDTKTNPPIENAPGLATTGYDEDLAAYTFNKGNKVIEVDDNDMEVVSYPIVPKDESPEDARLRREMLQYSLDEVGQVVAEIDLDGPAEYDYDDYEDEDYESDLDEDEIEEEDQYGRSTRPMLTEEYKQQMMELEKKLNAKMMENIGPRPDLHPLAEYADDARKLVVKKDARDEEEPPSQDSKPKKGVRFAEDLDVSPAPPPAVEQIGDTPIAPHKPTMADTIIERSGPAPIPPSPTSSKPTKVSRFKSTRSSHPQSGPKMVPAPDFFNEPPPMPTGPPGRPLSDAVVEHPPNVSNIQPPDELDPALIDREVQTEYHKMRNKMIQQQGGFLPSEEDTHNPLMEEVDGKVKKVSRFRAARLRKDGGVDEV